MPTTRRISDRRPAAILVALVVLCLVSLASGTEGSIIANGVRTVASVAGFPFVKALNYFRGGIDYATGIVVEYDAIRDETVALERSLGAMMQRVAEHQELEAENKRLRGMLHFTRTEPQLTMVPVEVIQRDRKGMMTIDRGSIHGIRESMCVLSSSGVIGLVTRVEPITSHVVTLQSADCRVDAMILRNRVRGTVHGSGSDLSRICNMHYIDLKDEVAEGDLVVTSPDSVFPAGIPIGRVVNVEDMKGPLSKSAGLMPAADPFRVDEVFVLERADERWQDLAGPVANDTETDVPPSLMDMETIQERYAP